MYLPLNTNAMSLLIDTNASIINKYINKGVTEEKSLLISKLENLRDTCVSVATQMYSDMGYEGKLDAQEKAFNTAIKELQKETLFLNGKDLENFMIKGLSEALPYSAEYQQIYEDWLSKFLQENTFESLTDEELQPILSQIFQEMGYKGGYTFRIVDGMAQGYRIIGGRARGSTAKIKLTSLLSSQGKTFLNKWVEKVGSKLAKPEVETDDSSITVNFEISEQNIYSILKTSETPAPPTKTTIAQLISADPNLVVKVKDFLYKKITDSYKGKYEDIFKGCVEEVIYSANQQDLFAGKNAPNKMTGLLGEIQGLYFVRVIIRNRKEEGASVKWVATQTFNGGQLHNDLIFQFLERSYGIQIKNTTAPEAKKEVNFQSFSRGLIQEKMGSEALNFIIDKKDVEYFTKNLHEDSILYDAVVTFIGMKNFNVPYKYADGKYQTANLQETGEIYPDLRNKVLEYSKLAEKCALLFAASMMFMQMSTEIKDAGANTLYIVAGSIAISTATILSQMIENIEKEVQKFSLNFDLRNKDNEKSENTIIEFFNSKGHHKGVNLTFQSSYNFF